MVTSTRHPLRASGSDWWVGITVYQPMGYPLGHYSNITQLSDIVVSILCLIFSINILSQMMIICNRLTPSHHPLTDSHTSKYLA